VSTDPTFASSTRAILNPADNSWTASVVGAPVAGIVYARQILSRDLYTPLWDNVQAGPVAEYGYNFGADLKVTKTADQTTAHLGQPVTYTVTVTNPGPDDATGVALVDSLSGDALPIVAVAGASPTTISGQTVTAALGTVPAGGSATLTIVARGVLAGPLIDAALVSADQTNPNPSGIFASSTSALVPANPTVVSANEVRAGGRVTALALTFSQDMNPSTVAFRRNERLVRVLRAVRGRPRTGSPIPLRAAKYDPATRTVSLIPRRPLSAKAHYELILNARPPLGLQDTLGRPLISSAPTPIEGALTIVVSVDWPQPRLLH
jgi:uncharacterized repeat protein (TIGR01451 family)